VRHVRFEVASVEEIGFPESSFDVVLSTFGVMFCADHEGAARDNPIRQVRKRRCSARPSPQGGRQGPQRGFPVNLDNAPMKFI